MYRRERDTPEQRLERVRARRRQHVMEAPDADYGTGRVVSPIRTPSPRVIRPVARVSVAEQEVVELEDQSDQESTIHLADLEIRCRYLVEKYVPAPPLCMCCQQYVKVGSDIVRCCECDNVEHLMCFLKRAGTDNCWQTNTYPYQVSRPSKCLCCQRVVFF